MFSIEQLLIPVSLAEPCGADLSFSAEVDAVSRARQHDDPALDQGEWTVALKEADWSFVASACAQLIQAHSKDLRLAVWLAEALARTRGLRGLADGFGVIAGLCERYWDSLHPASEQGDHEQRIGNLSWLLAQTPALIRHISPAGQDPAAFDAALLEDAEYCASALRALEQAVDARLGADGPSFSAAREALQHAVDCLALLAPADEGMQGLADDDAAQGASEQACAGGMRCAGHGGAPATRGQALAQLRQIAEFFRRTEPHSPVAYLADKAAGWGELPLHEWLRSVVKDPAQSAHLDELLGVRQASE